MTDRGQFQHADLILKDDSFRKKIVILKDVLTTTATIT
jgi:hypothetical protein